MGQFKHKRTLCFFLCALPSISVFSQETQHALAHYELRITETQSSQLISTIDKFAHDDGFNAKAERTIREGRPVDTVMLQRDDGVMIIVDSFLKQNTYDIMFYAKQQDTKYDQAKADLLKDIKHAFGENVDLRNIQSPK